MARWTACVPYGNRRTTLIAICHRLAHTKSLFIDREIEKETRKSTWRLCVFRCVAGFGYIDSLLNVPLRMCVCERVYARVCVCVQHWRSHMTRNIVGYLCVHRGIELLWVELWLILSVSQTRCFVTQLEFCSTRARCMWRSIKSCRAKQFPVKHSHSSPKSIADDNIHSNGICAFRNFDDWTTSCCNLEPLALSMRFFESSESAKSMIRAQ